MLALDAKDGLTVLVHFLCTQLHSHSYSIQINTILSRFRKQKSFYNYTILVGFSQRSVLSPIIFCHPTQLSQIVRKLCSLMIHQFKIRKTSKVKTFTFNKHIDLAIEKSRFSDSLQAFFIRKSLVAISQAIGRIILLGLSYQDT